VTGGYENINTRFTEHLLGSGVKIKYNAKVNAVKKTPEGMLEVLTEKNESCFFDYVISTLPSKTSVGIAPGLHDQERIQHTNIKYLGVICPSVILRKKISPFYVTNLTDNWQPFTGVIEMTALINTREIQGNHLIYLPKYVDPDDPLFSLNCRASKYFSLILFKCIRNYQGLYSGEFPSEDRIRFTNHVIQKNFPDIYFSSYYYIIVLRRSLTVR
jgi:protoporphyrinogen oxidase